MTRGQATLIGASTIINFAFLTLFTAASGAVPPFQLSAMAFTVGALVGAVNWVKNPSAIKQLRQPALVWLIGVTGLFGYHFFYFTALRNAPPVEAALINYLWPLLIVVFSALLPGEKLKPHHIVGALLGLGGAILIVTKAKGITVAPEHAFGYLMGLCAALAWSSYSVLSRRVAHVPTNAVTGFCAATALLSLICHLVWEQTVWPEDLGQWLAILGMGLGPLGSAFYTWDIGMKKGDIQLLGAGAYMVPLLATLIMIAFGFSQLTWVVGVACLLITFGALIAAKDLIRRKKPMPQPPATDPTVD
ncbi:drug/metabolite transporter (DMT)-like permease [Maritalea mobilis]|uniref:Drug/metabolite transporter (DMT)-like permease n=1 Tax=Maritalea mobilis TaxID=483324 RepID=A0A4R6VS84_9HYPH|nr:EamA family transporter [Maritalea mobilis]TDQ66892.1 drug/metabolite transporter (DMT)-like permease [Maritalea mobilis]